MLNPSTWLYDVHICSAARMLQGAANRGAGVRGQLPPEQVALMQAGCRVRVLDVFLS